MKQFILTLAFVLVCCSLTLGQSNKIRKNLVPKHTDEADRQMILQLEDQFRLAKLKKDVIALDRILADEYIGTNQNGNTRNKVQLKELFADFPIRSLTLDTTEVLICGTTAIVRGRQSENGGQMRFMRAWVKQKGQWHLLANEQTNLARRP